MSDPTDDDDDFLLDLMSSPAAKDKKGADGKVEDTSILALLTKAHDVKHGDLEKGITSDGKDLSSILDPINIEKAGLTKARQGVKVDLNAAQKKKIAIETAAKMNTKIDAINAMRKELAYSDPRNDFSDFDFGDAEFASDYIIDDDYSSMI